MKPEKITGDICKSEMGACGWLLALGSIFKVLCPERCLSECLITVGDVRITPNCTHKMEGLNAIPPLQPKSAGHEQFGRGPRTMGFSWKSQNTVYECDLLLFNPA